MLLIIITIAALAVGIVMGLSLMTRTMDTQSRQPTSQPAGATAFTNASPINIPIPPPVSTRETVVITQPAREAPSAFLYENTAQLQRPPAKPFYLPTRGEPQPYQQVGILMGEERGKKGEQLILPLIGRQTHPGSSRYHYYTSTNGYHPMKLPVMHKKRTCNDSTGCEEIFSGNLVRVKGYDIDFNADVYPSADPVYIL